jgi:phytoene synthase
VDELKPSDPVLGLALAWQPRATRPALAALFALDQRLAGVVARAREPLLAQMRLAWWRDQLGSGAEPVAGEPLLAEIAAHWVERTPHLAVLADGWENLLGDAPLAADAIDAFASARGEALAAFADLAGASPDRDSALAAGRRWALADFAWQASDPDERERALALGKEVPLAPVRTSRLRGVAVLGGLARRALERGEPLLSGRGAVLRAMRLGMFGG